MQTCISAFLLMKQCTKDKEIALVHMYMSCMYMFDIVHVASLLDTCTVS